MKRRLLISFCIALFPLCCMISSAHAITILGNTGSSTEGLGDFSAELTYNFLNSTNAALTISLTNISPLANGGYITAFIFNNPGDDAITGVSLSPSDLDFGLLGAPDFNDGINGAPFGDFDIGASTGGGNPAKGIAVGVTETFNFNLTGSGLDTLTVLSFISELSNPCQSNQTPQFLVARFRGFEDDGSDKVPGHPGDGDGGNGVIPEPTTMSLLGLGLLGLAKLRRKT